MVMPFPGYPHAESDEDLIDHIAHFSKVLERNLYQAAQHAPMVQIGLAEQQRRATRSLIEAIDTFKVSSGRAADRILVVTWFLVGLTLALLGATIALIVTSSG